MKMPGLGDQSDFRQSLEDALGYLNFSSGSADPKFFASLNAVFRHLDSRHLDSNEGCRRAAIVHERLGGELDRLERSTSAFADAHQARSVLRLVFGHFFDAYREFHRDLLFHQTADDLVQPFFLGRMFEAVLAQGPPWEEVDRIVTGGLAQLNEYVGYRPVAVLESKQKIEPYEHERVRPIPLYIDGAGVAVGRYQPLIEIMLEILRQSDPDLLVRAWFSPEVVEELALDPRAYDFDHPVNKRPNYHFGQWDPHRIDTKGRYRRLIVQQVTLDALLARLHATPDLPHEELQFEAAAVLAGTILMASGTSGSGPDSHDSTTTLSTLLPHIANYRDDFYEQLLARVEGPHGHRLRQEAAKLRQPFGGARQHLNQELARLRAVQLQQVHLAQLFARMGYPEAAVRQAQTVDVASARMLCEIFCRLTLGHRAIDRQRFAKVAQYQQEIDDLLKRGIGCGAIVDPWNIVAFGGNFSLFPSLENSVHDDRVDTLIELVEQIFTLSARAWSEAAAHDDTPLEQQFSAFLSELAAWWDQFAASTVSGVKRLVGKEIEVSTNLVAGALNAWHKAGAAAGDVRFWNMFVDQFDSPKAFQLVVEALLDQNDQVASMALLIQWLSQANRVPLDDGDSSFHRLTVRWMADVERTASSPAELEQRWSLVGKLFDYFEANADEYWMVPRLDLTEAPAEEQDRPLLAEEGLYEEEEDDSYLYSAAYDEMTYEDTTDDGIEGDMLETGADPDEFALEHEARRLGDRLAFLSTLARLWKQAAGVWGTAAAASPEQQVVFRAWHRQASRNRAGLLELLANVHRLSLPHPSGDHDSVVEYDRRRLVKEALIERIAATSVEMSDADSLLLALSNPSADEMASHPDVAMLRATLANDADASRNRWTAFGHSLDDRPILYIPLSRGGDPAQIVAARTTQKTLIHLLKWLPRLGMIRETCQLMRRAQEMESRHAVGPGAVTEFDRLFEVGYKAIVECIVDSADAWTSPADSPREPRLSIDGQLVECLQQLTECQLKHWLAHSRTLRLSVVEKVAGDEPWQAFVRFVEQYGGDLFTQKFLNLGNLRGILHQGVDNWLAGLCENPGPMEDVRLLRELDESITRAEAVKHLNLALEAVVENFAEYRDYNSTTTQSDRGELLHTFIDFLRLRTEYDRVAWNLRPVVIAHEIMVARGHPEAAELWRRALAERISEVADRHQARLTEMCRNYGMRLSTISDRISERFVQPLAIDRVRALVRPAMDEAGQPGHPTTFALLEQEITELAREPTGIGYDLPPWLIALEEEVALARSQQRMRTKPYGDRHPIPQRRLSLDEIQAQLDAVAGS